MRKTEEDNHFVNNNWMTTATMLSYFGISRSTLYRWCVKKKVYSVKVGGTILFPKDLNEEMLKRMLKNNHRDLDEEY